MSTIKATNLQNASSATINVVNDASGNVTVGGTLAMTGGGSFLRNRIINGDMRIDQRNAGAAVTINASGSTYSVDRWYAFGQTADGVFTLQQDTTVPTGYTNSLKATVTTADASIGATQVYRISQAIEGLNCSDLGFGTAAAQNVTLSFWVRSSLTGSFAGNLANNGFSRAYPFTFSINSSNTWEQKSIVIPGDTTGTWLTTNGVGIQVSFVMGMGSTYTGTANAWNAGTVFAPTGSTNIIATNGATFYITGVQLEVGSIATPFERRQYGTELMLCQRYYETNAPVGTAPANGVTYNSRNLITAFGTADASISTKFIVTKRTAPTTVVIYGGNIVAGSQPAYYDNASTWAAVTSNTAGVITSNAFDLDVTKTSGFTKGYSYIFNYGWAASAEL